MLKHLHIENIALIDKLDVDFDSRLNILTGETGAGKSIIIDSINFVLGERADKSLIKHGSDFSLVEAVFDVNTKDLTDAFALVDLAPENTVILRRYMSSSKNECKINGKLVSVNMLKAFALNLVEVLGQHDNHILLDVKNHMGLLDSASTGIQTLKDQLNKYLNNLANINQSIKSLGGSEEERNREIAILKYEIEEIETANLSTEDETQLLEDRKVLQNAQKIAENLQNVLDNLYDTPNNAISLLKDAEKSINHITSYMDKLNSISERLSGTKYELVDIYETLKDTLSSLDYSENRLNQIEERLDLYNSLKRKFGKTVADIISYYNNAQNRLHLLQNAQAQISELNIQKSACLKDIYNVAVKLTALRKQTALSLQNSLQEQLKQVGMKNAKFVVDIQSNYTDTQIEGYVNEDGGDKIEFLFSANLGQPVKPLVKVISGGEMSRFMLAFKCVTQNSTHKTFIFDEIDAGIGGEVANIIAQKISRISKSNQVLCITHLAQIAVYANAHFRVTKTEDNGKTTSSLTRLTSNDQIQEIARMIGSSSATAIQHAKQLLKQTLED